MAAGAPAAHSDAGAEVAAQAVSREAFTLPNVRKTGLTDRNLTAEEMDRIWDEAWLDVINGASHPGRYQDDRVSRAFYEHAYRMNAARERADA